MRIESLVKKNNYVYIQFDNGKSEKVHYEVVLKFGFRRNDEVKEDEYRKLLEAEEEFALQESALRFLSIRPHSTLELRNKLFKKGYSKDKIYRVINSLNDKGYLSDRDFAERFIEENIKKKKGLLKIKAELLKKGIDREIIDSELSKLDSDQTLYDNAVVLAEKKISSLLDKNLTKGQIKQKLFGFLKNKGYPFEVINNVTEKLLTDISDKNEFD